MRILVLFLLCSNLFGQRIISDYDDTFRVSFSYTYDKLIKTYLKRTRYLEDYKILFQEVWDQPKYLLSSSPTLLLKRIKKDLEENEIDYIKFVARSPKNWFNKDYKVEELSRIIEQTAAPIILIGDDIHKDELAYQTILERYPEKVSTYYIRNTRSLIPGANRYNYALDIALKEWENERLSMSQLSLFVDRLLETPVELVNIKGYHCPILNLNRTRLEQVYKLPGSMSKRVLEIYGKYSKDCFEKKSFRF